MLCNAGSDKQSAPIDITSQTAQLQQFVLIMGAETTSAVHTILICVTFPCEADAQTDRISYDLHSRRRPYQAPPPSTLQDLQAAAGSAFVLLLAAACPNMCRLCVSGGIGEEALRLFGSHFPKLASLDIYDKRFSVGKSNGPTSQHYPLPHLTHLTSPFMYPSPGQVARLCQHLACPSLTHLDVKQKWFETGTDWELVPSQVKLLRTDFLPLSSLFDFPSNVHLGRLEHIQITAMSCGKELHVGMSVLAGLLRAAPSLQSLSSSSSEYRQTPNTLKMNDTSSMVIEDMCVLHQRMLAGFVLKGVILSCTHIPRAGELVKMVDVLKRMPPFHSFQCLNLDSQDEEQINYLPEMSLAFPGLQKLWLSGPWLGEVVPDGVEVDFKCMQSIHLNTPWMTAASVLRLVASMPRLVRMQASSQEVCGRWEDFQAQLQAIKIVTVDEIGASGERLGDWKLEEGGAEISRTFWKRDPIKTCWSKAAHSALQNLSVGFTPSGIDTCTPMI